MIESAKVEAILADVAAGSSLDAAVKAHEVASATFYRHLDANPEDAGKYARAREMRNDRMAEEILAIADTPMRGVKTTTKADGSTETVEGDMLEHRRLQVDSRKWLLSKLAPRKYGEFQRNEFTGPNGEAIQVNVSSTDAKL